MLRLSQVYCNNKKLNVEAPSFSVWLFILRAEIFVLFYLLLHFCITCCFSRFAPAAGEIEKTFKIEKTALCLLHAGDKLLFLLLQFLIVAILYYYNSLLLQFLLLQFLSLQFLLLQFLLLQILLLQFLLLQFLLSQFLLLQFLLLQFLLLQYFLLRLILLQICCFLSRSAVYFFLFCIFLWS